MAKNVISDIRNLQRRKARRRETDAVLEGVRLVEEALAAQVPLRGAVVSAALDRSMRGSALRTSLSKAGVDLTVVEDRELVRLADTDTPQGVVALATLREWTLQDVSITGRGCVVVLDGVQDPGNVGTIIRTSLGLGAAAVILLRGTARLHHPKVLRATMGAAFRLPIVHAADDDVRDWCHGSGITLWVADPAGRAIRSTPVPPRVALIVGSEAHGVQSDLARGAVKVAIPLGGRTDSLNAGIAAGILLYEVIGDD
jgi:TrmH family RNA methyltransferase